MPHSTMRWSCHRHRKQLFGYPAVEINPKQMAILVSGFSETDRVKKAQMLGADAHVKRPYITEKIGVAIRDELLKVTTSNAQV
jgi:hypothetical protein